MKRAIKLWLVFLFVMVPGLMIQDMGTSLRAALMYFPSEYNALYNEKVALELELKSVKVQFQNEKANLEGRIKDLEGQIEALNRKIDLLKDQIAGDKKQAEERIRELEKRTDILKKKGGDREKDLIEENRKLQERSDAEIGRLKQALKDEKEKSIKETEKIKGDYEKKISELQGRINTLNDEIAGLRKLNEFQKAELNRMSEQANDLEKQLQQEIKDGQIRLKRFHDRLVINIDDRISFDSGSARLKKEIFPALDKIAGILAKYQENRIFIEGHTDNVPISTKQFRNNWALSTERALSVLEYLLKHKKQNPSRFAAAGYGEYSPIVPNDTPENRSLNRRVDIVVIPRVTK